MTTPAIHKMLDTDWPEVSTIYFEGMRGGNATFQQQLPAWEDWNRGHLQDLRFVAVDAHNTVLGWVAVSPYSSRPVYRGVVELSIYVSSRAQRSGVGDALMRHMVEQSESLGFWTLYTGIFPENVGSVRLHQKHGFQLVGRRERIGQFRGVWRDVCLHERRSKVAGR
jgi:phosphinothricin acetyltransferase